MSQVAPVLGLAHVIETRQALKQSSEFPRWWRIPFGLLHFVSLAALAVLCASSLGVLGGAIGISGSDGYKSAALLVVGLSVGTLVMGPALNALFLVVAHPVSVIGSVAPITRWNLRRIKRDIAQDERQLASLKLRMGSKRLDFQIAATQMQRQYSWIENALSRMETGIKSGSFADQQRAEAEKLVADGKKQLADLSRAIADCESAISELSSSELAESLARRKASSLELDEKLPAIRGSMQALTERVLLTAAGAVVNEPPSKQDTEPT